MNLRLPVIGAIVAVAAGAAIMRSDHPPTPPPPFLTDTPQPRTAAEAAASSPTRPHRNRRVAPSTDTIVVYVAGEVSHGGMYTLPATARAIDALHAAGGPTKSADMVAINLAQSLSDGDEVAVPALGDDTSASTSHRSTSHRKKHKRHKGKHKRHRRHHPAASSDATSTSDSTPEQSRDPISDTDNTGEPIAIVDLNTADESELESLPGVGETLARRIVAFRDLTGPFASPDDLLDVSGVTQSKLDELQPYIKAVTAEQTPP